MSYGSNYYNYQIAVIFAILIVALLFLGIVVVGIYYGVVVNTRKKKTGEASRTRTPSSIPATRTNWQAGTVQPQQQQQMQIPSTPYSPDFQRQQEYSYDPRIQPGYIQQQPLVQSQQQPYGGYRDDIKVVRELQPEYVYQQGPVTWTNTQQVTETYPVSPVQQIGGGAGTSAYHMSSV